MTFSMGTGVAAPEVVAALRAGDEAGGDRRGRPSAALRVVSKGMGYGGTSDVVAEARAGYRDDDLDEAPASWAGLENLEERVAPGHLDPLVLAQLRAAT